MINFWKLTCETVKKQRDQYKAENEKIRDQFDYMNQSYMKLYEKNEKLSEQYNKILEERNSIIDDLPWYKAKVSRLERENERLEDEKGDYKAKYIIAKLHLKDVKDENTRLQNELYTVGLNQDEADDKIKKLERENEKLKEIKQEKEQLEESFQYQIEKRLEYFNKYQEHKALNNEISQHIGNKPSSSTYKYFRAKLNALEIREVE